MKIKLKDLKPNPYKKAINGGELNEDKVEKLKESIRKDGFWNNILCRQHNSNYQLAYGHHRVEAAIQVLGADHIVDIPCEKLSDEAMIRILGNENSMQNEEYTIYQVDQVLATQKFLEDNPKIVKRLFPAGDRELSKGGRYPEANSAKTISLFLGDRNWGESKVMRFLGLHKRLHPKILKELRNSPGTHRYKEISTAHGSIIASLKNKADQLKVYKAIKKHHLNKHQTQDLVVSIESKKSTAVDKPRRVYTLNKVAISMAKKVNDLLPILNNLIPLRKNMNKGSRLLLDNCLNRCRKTIDNYFKQEV